MKIKFALMGCLLLLGNLAWSATEDLGEVVGTSMIDEDDAQPSLSGASGLMVRSLGNHVALGAIAFLITESDWYVGGSGMGFGSSKLDLGYGGLFLAKDLWSGARHDVVLGGLLGAGRASLGLSTEGNTGRINQGFFAFEPSLTVSMAITSFMKVGVTGAYFLPMARSLEIRANSNPGISRLVGPSWSGGLLFSFGNFRR